MPIYISLYFSFLCNSILYISSQIRFSFLMQLLSTTLKFLKITSIQTSSDTLFTQVKYHQANSTQSICQKFISPCDMSYFVNISVDTPAKKYLPILDISINPFYKENDELTNH
ncbi:hypothetical protein EUGRSUZ_G00299 [Eucalyptus grandis]|uniref:Uncharacterized protein n=2 Tax=Eucalyptus grandis TaxID=71139 RepID=A0ACC3K2B3_EUCGR|nr:hypothetical protein EUGRSUZ_G00299 [Eucalyptus grandis]